MSTKLPIRYWKNARPIGNYTGIKCGWYAYHVGHTDLWFPVKVCSFCQLKNLVVTIQDLVQMILPKDKNILRLLTCGSVNAGKSTLIGRLLHDAKQICMDQLANLEVDSKKSGYKDNSVNLALLVDGLQAEREQGITIDVAYRYFSTANRKFILADAPGHDRYTCNMITGASTCDLAIILIDASKGVRRQTKRHTILANMLGIKQFIVAINKMDRIGFSEEIFNMIRDDFLKFASSLDEARCSFIPLSALTGDNAVRPSRQMPWYKDKPLMAQLETVEITRQRNAADLRYPVQYVNNPDQNFRGYCGTMASGVVSRGDEIIVLPSGKVSRVDSILYGKEQIESACNGMAITLTLDHDLPVSRGDLIVHPHSQPTIANGLTATVVWMSGEPVAPGSHYDFRSGTRTIAGTVRSIHHRIDVNTLKKSPAGSLAQNDIGLVEILFDQTVCFDSYGHNRTTGSFIFIDRASNGTVGAGMIC